MRKLVMHTDSGHGWLAVKIADAVQLGIADQISAYSYTRGQTVYLEEDSDAGLFMRAAAAQGFKYTIRPGRHCDRSPIRGYDRWVSRTAVDTVS
jgi:hypothetical protein